MSNLLENIAAGIIEGKLNEVPDLVQNALDEGLGPTKILENGLVVGMNEVGKRFKLGSMFVPEVLRSARTMHAGQELLRPLLVDSARLEWKQIGQTGRLSSAQCDCSI